jgi:hypothetical protein
LITITRLLARQIWEVMKRLFPRSDRWSLRAIHIQSGPNGLRIQASNGHFGLRYDDGVAQSKHSWTAPPEIFRTLSGSKSIPVTLTKSSERQILARWQEGAMPQSALFDEPSGKPEPSQLEVPGAWAQNETEILLALHETMAITDKTSIRYALGNIQLQGKAGAMVGTDGHQVHIQNGFKFGFKDDLLIPATTVFNATELGTQQSVLIGKTPKDFVVQSGPWTIFVGIQKEGRFPRVQESVPSYKDAKTILELAGQDIKFLADAIPKLPNDDEQTWPITIDLNGQVVVRARGMEEGPPTELLLRNSRHQGPDTRLNINRKYLSRALRLGFDRIYVQDATHVIQCRDPRRNYAWMPLDSNSTISPHSKAVVIESPLDDQAPASSRRTRQSIPTSPTPTTIPMSRRRTQSTPAPTATPQPQAPKAADKPSGPGLIEQVTELRVAAKDLFSKATELLRSMKRQRRQHRIVQSTLQSLKDLQQVA